MKSRTHCRHPDRDVPGLVCGYPLPCPHHTLMIDPSGSVMVPPSADPKLVKLCRRIAEALDLAGVKKVISAANQPKRKRKRT